MVNHNLVYRTSKRQKFFNLDSILYGINVSNSRIIRDTPEEEEEEYKEEEHYYPSYLPNISEDEKEENSMNTLDDEKVQEPLHTIEYEELMQLFGNIRKNAKRKLEIQISSNKYTINNLPMDEKLLFMSFIEEKFFYRK